MDELIDAMEKKLSSLLKLGKVMDEMKSLTQSIKEDFDKDESFKNLIDVNELDEWAFSLIKNLQEIDKTHAVDIGKAKIELSSDLNFLNWENLKKGLQERGLVIIKDEQVLDFFNKAVIIAMNHFISKQEAREKAKELVEKSRKQIRRQEVKDSKTSKKGKKSKKGKN